MRLHVHDWGADDAPPLLCLHGVTSWGGRFRRLAEERLGAFHVFAPDLRGHGVSDWEPPWNLGAYVGDLVDTLDALHLERIDVVGHSFGGRLAHQQAPPRPARGDPDGQLDPPVWGPPQVALERAELTREDESYASLDEAVEAKLAANPRAQRDFVADEVPHHMRLGDDSRWRPRFSRSAVVAAYGEMAKPPPLGETSA